MRDFLKDFLRITEIPKKIQLVEQQIPGETVFENEGESDGLPDACFFDNEGWAVLVESKIQASIREVQDQLDRHAKAAQKKRYTNVTKVLISVDKPKRLHENVRAFEWRDVYKWFDEKARSSSRSFWARNFLDYMRIFESKMIAKDYKIEGTITMFNGIHFDKDKEPYTYREGKRLIRLFRSELQKRKDLHKIGVDPNGDGRPAITGSGQDGVWDFLSLMKARHAKQFTSFPHLTIGLNRDYASAAITVPNGMKGGFRSKLKQNGPKGFQELISIIERRLRPLVKKTGAKPIIYVHQRHYATQRSPAETDAKLIADMRTFVSGTESKVKHQPQWIEAIYGVLCNKKSNIQLGVEVQFPIACDSIRSHKAVDLYVMTWVAMSPILKFVLDENDSTSSP